MKLFKLPDLGEGLFEVEIVTWHVSVGDNVVSDQPLLSVETDKAIVEVPAPWSGRISKIFGKTGDNIKIGDPLVEFEIGDRSDAGSIVGTVSGEVESAPPLPSSISSVGADARVPSTKASPAVRSLARQKGIDLTTITPTGTEGSITLQDVESASKDVHQGFEEIKGARRSMAKHMSLSQASVVPATLTDDVDIDIWFGKDDVTVRLIHAIVAASKAVPSLNAWFEKDQRRFHDHVDLGIAVDLGKDLFVPVIRDAGSLSASDLRSKLEEMKQAVKGRALEPSDLKEQTITLSNFGLFAGQYATMIIVPPQVAIIGAGKIRKKVVVVDDSPAIRWVLPLSLTFDHRAVTGGEAARFLAVLMDDLASDI